MLARKYTSTMVRRPGSSTSQKYPKIRWKAVGIPWCAQAKFLHDLMQRTGLVDAMGPEKQTPLMWVTGMKKPTKTHGNAEAFFRRIRRILRNFMGYTMIYPA
jgi:hypothetical protein